MKTYLKKNKALLLLPLALLPFIVLIFYILGGGKEKAGKEDQGKNTEKRQGANYLLPEAESTIEIFDKMEAYKQEVKHASTTDYNVTGDNEPMADPGYGKTDGTASADIASGAGAMVNNGDIPENLLAHIKQKEKDIQQELDGQKNGSDLQGNGGSNRKRYTGSGSRKQFSPKRNTVDPGRTASQHPEATIRSTGIEELDKVFDENLVLNRQNDSLKFILAQSQKQLAKIEQSQKMSFSMDKKQAAGFAGDVETSRLITAEIYETTTVLDGNRVKLRLLEETQVNGRIIKENTFIYGICTVKNERLHIEISRIPANGSFLPVKLAIHDLDGLPGLYVPDNVSRKVSKDVGGSTNTSSLFGVTNDPLTYAGIRAADRTAQTLLKRVRLKKVTLKKNTLVYILNEDPSAEMN